MRILSRETNEAERLATAETGEVYVIAPAEEGAVWYIGKKIWGEISSKGPAFHTSQMMVPEDEEEPGFCFDLGIVVDVEPDPDSPGEERCVVLCSHGSRLRYSANYLYIPLWADGVFYPDPSA